MTLTVEQIKAAAQVLVEVSRIYEYSDPQRGEWSALDLLSELPQMECYLDQQAIVEEITRRVVDSVIDGTQVDCAIKGVLRDFDIRRIDE